MGGAHVRERAQRGDRRRHASGEAVLVEGPMPQRARSARPSRPGDRTGGGGAYRRTSRVSAVMLAGIGPVKPFLAKYLIGKASHAAAPKMDRQRAAAALGACAATQAPHRRRARPRERGRTAQ